MAGRIQRTTLTQGRRSQLTLKAVQRASGAVDGVITMAGYRQNERVRRDTVSGMNMFVGRDSTEISLYHENCFFYGTAQALTALYRGIGFRQLKGIPQALRDRLDSYKDEVVPTGYPERYSDRYFIPVADLDLDSSRSGILENLIQLAQTHAPELFDRMGSVLYLEVPPV